MNNIPKGTSICFFNNKGGVGKTTLACNVASSIADRHNASVLLVDADPQCNATQLVLDPDLVESLYGAHAPKHEFDTLREVLEPINVGESTIMTEPRVVPRSKNRFGVALLPGHPKVAMLEDTLSLAWSGFSGGKLEGARRTNWNTQLLQSLKPYFDLIIFDVGPSLGALNRSVLVGVDFIVAPTGADIFSLIGIQNIGEWLGTWHSTYDVAYQLCLKSHGPEALEKYHVKAASTRMSRLIGYTAQQYITKTIRGERRPTEAYERILQEMPATIENSLAHVTPPSLRVDELRLGDVPHMYSLVPLAQTNHTPIHRLRSADGLNGGQFGQQKEYIDFIRKVSSAFLSNLETASGEASDD